MSSTDMRLESSNSSMDQSQGVMFFQLVFKSADRRFTFETRTTNFPDVKNFWNQYFSIEQLVEMFPNPY